MSGSGDPRRGLPSIDRLLARSDAADGVRYWGRELFGRALRRELEGLRAAIVADPAAGRVPGDEEIVSKALDSLERDSRPRLRPILNGTVVVLHTNLGRAPLSGPALERAVSVGRGYTNLEYDLAEGGRGGRGTGCEDWLCRLTGSEAALVVNNAAGAVALTVSTLARDRDVVVSRGELVEIGASFRLPEIVEAAGARLVEVGTTNRTRIDDYRAAIGDDTCLLLKVHPSNFRIEGFIEGTSLAELVELGRETGLPVAYDLGSGLLLPDQLPMLPPEPTPQASVAVGADLVMWSGDKLLGGPQAGILHGKREWIERLRRNPLYRALRVDKLILATLESTIATYGNPVQAVSEIPVLACLAESAESVEARAEDVYARLEAAIRPRVRIVALTSLVGGGTFPGVELPSAGWQLDGPAGRIEQLLRSSDPPLIARIEADRVLLDFRTLPRSKQESADIASIVSRALAQLPPDVEPGSRD